MPPTSKKGKNPGPKSTKRGGRRSSSPPSESDDGGVGYIGGGNNTHKSVCDSVNGSDSECGMEVDRVMNKRRMKSDDSEKECLNGKGTKKKTRKVSNRSPEDVSMNESENVSANVNKDVNVNTCVNMNESVNECCVSDSMNREEEYQFVCIKKIGCEIRKCVMNENNKVSKAVGEFLLNRVNEYEAMLGKLLCVNANLRGRMSECENERKQINERVRVVSSVTGPRRSFAQVAATNKVNERVNDRVNVSMPVKVMNARPGFALVVKGGVNDSADVVMSKLIKNVSAKVDVRVNSMRAARGGGVVIETASVKDRDKLKGCKELSE